MTPQRSDSPRPASTEQPRTALDQLWYELEADALASDGPIRDGDIRDAIKHWRSRIEAEAGAASPSEPLRAALVGHNASLDVGHQKYHCDGTCADDLAARAALAAPSQERASEPAGLDVLRTRRVLCEMEHEIRHPGNGVAESCIECLRAADGLIADLTASAATQERP